MALSYTQKTSDNSLITKYVRNCCPVFLSWSLTQRVWTENLVRPVRHLPCPERFVPGKPAFLRQLRWRTGESDESCRQGVLFA